MFHRCLLGRVDEPAQSGAAALAEAAPRRSNNRRQLRRIAGTRARAGRWTDNFLEENMMADPTPPADQSPPADSAPTDSPRAQTHQRAPEQELELKLKKNPDDQDAKVDVGSDQSMDASDPVAVTAPGGNEPAPSSSFPEPK